MEVSITPARRKKNLTLCEIVSKKHTCDKKGKGTAINNNPIAIDDAQETDIVPYGNEQEDSEMIVAMPENNEIHLCYIRNMTGKNCHPENNINQNDNVVVLQIPVKCLNSVKPKLKEAKEMKKQLQAHNPHMKIE